MTTKSKWSNAGGKDVYAVMGDVSPGSSIVNSAVMSVGAIFRRQFGCMFPKPYTGNLH